MSCEKIKDPVVFVHFHNFAIHTSSLRCIHESSDIYIQVQISGQGFPDTVLTKNLHNFATAKSVRRQPPYTGPDLTGSKFLEVVNIKGEYIYIFDREQRSKVLKEALLLLLFLAWKHEQKMLQT